MAKHRLISAARRELFELFEEVTANDGRKVIIEHRTSPKKAVLVSADYLESLERQTKASKGSAFKLFGSGKLLVEPDDALTEVRREHNEAAEKRLLSFAARPKTRGQ